MIPHILHRIWNTSTPPPEYAKWLNSWAKHCPDYHAFLWTPSQLREFIADHHPDRLQKWLDLPSEIQRIDLARFLILEHIGGIYLDLDMECLKPLDFLLAPRALLLGYCTQDCSRVSNAILGSAPHQHFWLECFDTAIREFPQRMSRTEDKVQQVLHTTGPIFLTEMVFKHLSIRVPLDPERLFPYEYKDRVEGATREWPRAYTRHHWAGSWVKAVLKS